MSVTIAELAARFGCELLGDPDARISGIGTLSGAGPGDLGFFANQRYREALRATRAGAIVLAQADAEHCPVPALISANPYATYARIATLLCPPRAADPGVHATAVVHASAQVAATAEVGPGAIVAAGTQVGEHVVISAGVVVGERCRIGAHSLLHPNVTLCDDVHLGERVIVHPGAVLGGDGFGFARESSGWFKVPQLGGVRIGNDVEVGACTCIDRGAIEHTVIGDGVKLDNQIQVAHNVQIGEHTVVAACAGISGSTVIGKRCVIAGMVGFVGHIEIADDVVVTGRSMVSRSLNQAGTYSGALPVDEAGRFRKNSARFRKLDELARKVMRLEKQLADLEKGGDDNG